MLHRIFGKTGCGKTTYIYNKLGECIENRRHTFLVVPEQGALKTETEVINALGNGSNSYVEVINFKRLCNRVFRETGGLSGVHLDKGADKLIMSYAVDEVRDFLTQYKDSAQNTEFVKKALQSINELSSSALGAADLEKCAEIMAQNNDNQETQKKLYDLSLILTAYETLRDEISGVCGDIYDRLCQKLEKSAFFAGKSVFLDGFYGFTAKELKIISLMSEDADEVYVTLPVDERYPDEIFTRSLNTAKQLKKIAEDTGVGLEDVHLSNNYRHKEGSALKKYADEFCAKSLSCADMQTKELFGLEILKCEDSYCEAKAAASVVAKLIRNEAHFSDICITAKNVNDYDGIIDAVFNKCGFPLSFDHPEKLCDTALYSLVCAAFDSVSGRNGAAVIYIKTGLSGLSDERADLLETYAGTWNISPSMYLKDDEWTMNPKGYTEQAADKEILSAVNEARRHIYFSFEAFSQELKDAATVKDYAKSVWQLLCTIAKLCGKETFDDRADGIHLDLLCNCLDTMVNTVGQKNCDRNKFLQLFKLCAEDCDTGKLPERLDCISFSPAELVRASNVKYMIVLGVNDGVFPSGVQNAGLFSDRERPILLENGLKISEPDESSAFDELFVAYSVLCSATDAAFITYAEKDSAGHKLFASVIAESASKITGTVPKYFDKNDFENSYCSDELIFEEYLTLAKGAKKNAAYKYLSENKEYSQKLKFLSKAYCDSAYLDEDTLQQFATEDFVTSYTRLESFNKCPFSYFCQYQLKLQPEKQAKLDMPGAGSVMHRVLERFIPAAVKHHKEGLPLTKEESHLLIDKLMEELFCVLTRGCESVVTKRFSYLYSRLSRQLYSVADAVIEELCVSDFEISAYELPIVSEQAARKRDKDDVYLTALPIKLPDGSNLHITGQIDRVDEYIKEGKRYIRIVDYKTGSKVFRNEDILSGFNLQMLLYMYSICGGKSALYGENPIPAGIMYLKVADTSVGDQKALLGYSDEEFVSSIEAHSKTDGRFLKDEDIVLAMDKTSSRRFVPVAVSGGKLSDSRYLLKLENMGKLINFAAETASVLAQSIRQGNKEISPFSDSGINACEYCDMLPVCQGYKTQRKMKDNSALEEEIFKS